MQAIGEIENWVMTDLSTRKQQELPMVQSNMAGDRLKDLEEAGLAFLASAGMANNEKWQEMLEAFKIYKNEYDSTGYVPDTCAENPKLGKWASQQRLEYKQWQLGDHTSILTKKRFTNLKNEGFVFVKMCDSGISEGGSETASNERAQTESELSDKKLSLTSGIKVVTVSPRSDESANSQTLSTTAKSPSPTLSFVGLDDSPRSKRRRREQRKQSIENGSSHQERLHSPPHALPPKFGPGQFYSMHSRQPMPCDYHIRSVPHGVHSIVSQTEHWARTKHMASLSPNRPPPSAFHSPMHPLHAGNPSWQMNRRPMPAVWGSQYGAGHFSQAPRSPTSQCNNREKPPHTNCTPLQPPVPSMFQGNIDEEKDAAVPLFANLVNFPEDFMYKHAKPLPEGMCYCVMCGKARVNSAARKHKLSRRTRKGSKSTSMNANICSPEREGSSSSSIDSNAQNAVIPAQNKGLCTACDVQVWVVNESSTEIKWCKGCKNFRPWAGFGQKGCATKCVRCRERQREKYAKQKESGKLSPSVKSDEV
eukprot:scaffold120586_cov50-Attheya_sp.AAC.1